MPEEESCGLCELERWLACVYFILLEKRMRRSSTSVRLRLSIHLRVLGCWRCLPFNAQLGVYILHWRRALGWHSTGTPYEDTRWIVINFNRLFHITESLQALIYMILPTFSVPFTHSRKLCNSDAVYCLMLFIYAGQMMLMRSSRTLESGWMRGQIKY